MANIIEYAGRHRVFSDPAATKLGFQLDQNAEEKIFQFPRYFNDFDLSQFTCFLLLSGADWTDRVELSRESCGEETLTYRWTAPKLVTAAGKPVVFQPVFQKGTTVLHLDKDIFTVCSSVDPDGEMEPFYPDYIDRLKKLETIVGKMSLPNHLINGNSIVWQRGESFTLTSGNTKWVYCDDRWRYKFTGASGASATVAKNSGGGVKITISGSGTVTRQQVLENSFTGLLTSRINGESTSAPFSGKTVAQTFTKTSTVEWTKLEASPVPTPFSPRSYSEELTACQRFYQVIENARALMRNCVTTSGANNYHFPTPFPSMIRKPDYTFTVIENSGVSECGYYINGTNGGYVYFYASASIVSILCTVRLDAEIYS